MFGFESGAMANATKDFGGPISYQQLVEKVQYLELKTNLLK